MLEKPCEALNIIQKQGMKNLEKNQSGCSIQAVPKLQAGHPNAK